MVWSPRVADVTGRFVSASNVTLLGVTEDGVRVVYKPATGERPLWDFPAETLAVREMLTYRVSQVLQLDVVPETVIGDGPYGIGAIQRYLDPDPDFESIELVRMSSGELWPIALLDVLCNNADRKLGHILRSDGRLFAIDHGLTFHEEEKLRTVLWGLAGRPFPDDLVGRLSEASSAIRALASDDIEPRLGRAAARAFRRRVAAVIADPRHPEPPEERPALPWPPY